MPVLTAATTEEAGAPADGADPREMVQTAVMLVRLWFVGVFSAVVFVATFTGFFENAPGGYLFFWGALALVGLYYAATRTPDVLGRKR